MPGSRLCRIEREHIAVGIAAGRSFREIAGELGRAPSTVSREVTRNRNSKGQYWAHGAQRKANLRARRPKPFLLDDPHLAEQIFELIVHNRYSPWATARVLSTAGTPISHETIYQAIYRGQFGKPKTVLNRPRTRRKRRTRTGRNPNNLGTYQPISNRPPQQGPGHWEADLIVGAGNYTAAVVLSQPATKQTLITALGNRTADHTAHQLITTITQHIPTHQRHTLTLDQGREFTRWQHIATTTGFDIYFCQPRSPWQKPHVENTNAILRRWIPKRQPIPQHQTQLDYIANLINNMPRRSLQGQTPNQALTNLTNATTT
jgi:IS30 family transposase